MKALIALLILFCVFWVGKRLFLTYQAIENQQSRAEQAEPSSKSSGTSTNLPGLPSTLEASLSAAEARGADGLRAWLETYRSHVRDPRLASIELDYVVLISLQNPEEARRVFQSVKGRTPTFSPVYERVKKLERTLQ